MLSGQEKVENMEIIDQTRTQSTGLVQHFKNNWHRYGLWTLGTAGSLGVDYALGAPITSIFNPLAVLAASTIYGLPAAASTVAYDKVVDYKNTSKKRKREEKIVKNKPTPSLQTSDIAESVIEPTTPVLLFQSQGIAEKDKEISTKKVTFEDEITPPVKPKAKRQKTTNKKTDNQATPVEHDPSEEELKNPRKVRRSSRRNSRKDY